MATLFIPTFVEREDVEIDFEYLNIKQDFILTHWTFVARSVKQGDKYPMLFILYSFGQAFGTRPIVNRNCTDTVYPNVYECTVNPQLIQTGDIVALDLPPLSSAQLVLSFILNRSPRGESLADSQVEGFPLITLGVG